MTRSEIASQRRHCDVKANGPTNIRVAAKGGDIHLAYLVAQADKCLAAAASDTDWADVLRASGESATVRVAANHTGQQREATVRIVARNGKSISFLLSQAPAGGLAPEQAKPHRAEGGTP